LEWEGRVEGKAHSSAGEKWHAPFVTGGLQLGYLDFAICWFGATSQKCARFLLEMRMSQKGWGKVFSTHPGGVTQVVERERERERESVCVCVCEREREREREKL
jgi:hypothetical protein